MAANLFPLISYILISTFTPGPSNISSASMAMLYGYRKTLRYQLGLAAAVFFLMMIGGMFSAALLRVFPFLEPVLRYAGAAYILYLAASILKASYTLSMEGTPPLRLVNGFLLNLLNPKLMVYAFSLFSTFLAPITRTPGLVSAAAIGLATLSFCSTSLWALSGTAIQRFLRIPRMTAMVNTMLSLSLVYTALSLAGLP
jgi:cysteine/O-acetylserine efflux protein